MRCRLRSNRQQSYTCYMGITPLRRLHLTTASGGASPQGEAFRWLRQCSSVPLQLANRTAIKAFSPRRILQCSALMQQFASAACQPRNHESLLPDGSRSTAPASGRIGQAHKRRRRRLRARNFANCRPKPALAARQKRGAVGSMRQRVFEQYLAQIRLCRIADKVSSKAKRMRGNALFLYM